MSIGRHFWHNEIGSIMVEAAIVLPIMFVFLLGAIDFLNAFQQWNLAAKAVEVGARIAAVSDPVANGLDNISTDAVSGSVAAGDPMPKFQVTCDGATATCTCTAGTCTGMGTFSWKAMNEIVCGRDDTSSTQCDYPTQCHNATSYYFVGMCDLFPSITAANVKIIYTQTGLGFAGRSGGPVPTITVLLQNLPFHFFFLSGFLHFGSIDIPGVRTTVTGEILSSAAQ